MANKILDLNNEKVGLLEEYAILNDNREESDKDNPRFAEIENRVKAIELETKQLTRSDWAASVAPAKAPISNTRALEASKDRNAEFRDWLLSGNQNRERAMTFATNTTGGYLQVNELDTEIRQKVIANSSLLPYFTVLNEPGLDKRHFILGEDDNEATAQSEYPTSSLMPNNGQPSIDRKIIAKHKIMSGVVSVTREDAMNPNVDLVAYCAQRLAERMARKIDKESQIGTGNGETGWEGIFTVASNSGWELADKDNFEAHTINDIIKQQRSLDENIIGPGRPFVFHRSTVAALEMQTNADGVNLWQGQYTADGTGALQLRWRGSPILTSPYLSELGDANAVIGLYGDFKRQVVIFATGPLASQLVTQYDMDRDLYNMNFIQFFGCGYTDYADDYLAPLTTPAS